MARQKRTAHFSARYLVLGLVFVVLCGAFVIALIVTQLRGPQRFGKDREEGYVRTYTVPGARGEIFDREGRLLVGNSTSYDLIYEYGAMPDTRREVNQSLLAIHEAILRTGNGDKLSEDLFVLEGTYPNMKLTAALRNKESDESKAYERFLSRQEWDRSEVDSEKIMKYFTKRYQLAESQYSNEEITVLMRFYYEMERVDFGQYASYTIASDVNMVLVTSLEESNVEGVNFSLRSERVYSHPGIASHILGRLGKITAETADYYLALDYPLDALVGTSGCEAAFEEILRGTDGVMAIRYDDDGNMIEKYYVTEPKGGNDVYLTIDLDLQIAAEEGLKENVNMVDGSDAGAITVLDPDTGEILAIASYPTYDLTQFDSADYYASLLANGNLPLYNRALQGVYAPGSTYKIGAALAALENGYIDGATLYKCEKNYKDTNNEETGHTCLHFHGELNVIESIRESCNVFFYRLGELMGIEKITPYTKRLGLGSETGIELGDETGMIAGPEYRDGPWHLGDDLNAAIGQSDHGYTPLQLSVYMSTVVNGGTRYRAHLLESVREFYTAEVLQQTEPEVLDTVDFSDATYELLINAMEQVVSHNVTLQSYFRDVPVTVGGKTGTAQVTGKTDYAVFCGFAPSEKPELVISCILEEGAVGARAAYAVSRVMKVYFEKNVE